MYFTYDGNVYFSNKSKDDITIEDRITYDFLPIRFVNFLKQIKLNEWFTNFLAKDFNNIVQWYIVEHEIFSLESESENCIL